MAINSIFQNYCEKAMCKLSEDEINEFKETTRDSERIKLLFNCAKEIPMVIIDNEKNNEIAQQLKLKGNQLFQNKRYEEALRAYNFGILACPQDTECEKELLTILISNRSATYFEMGEFRKVFDDIDYVSAIGAYPQKLQYKIWLRKAKCYQALGNERYADETFALAITSLKHAQLDEKSLAKKTEEIEKSSKTKRNNGDCKKRNNEVVLLSNSDKFPGGNTEFVSAHKFIRFDYDPLLGRFARATENIEVGTIIVEENAHCAVVSRKNSLTNCQYCFLSTNQPIACPNCAKVIFCSLNCERKANATFHKFECKIQPILQQAGASINCLMALRMITQKPLKFFQDKRKSLEDFLKDHSKKPAIKTKVYRSDDYNTVFFLCRNEGLRQKGELVHFSVMAIYLLRLLKYSKYFGKQAQNDNSPLTDEQVFIGSLILRHLQILQFNSHEVSELVNVDGGGTKTHEIETFYMNESIGAGLYPTLALFNHSCDPSIVRYNVGSKMVARSVKPIKSGDIVYENYGPVYTSMEVNERRATLKERYFFDCYCTPCQDEWPLFENMDSNYIKIGCQSDNCPFELTLYRDDFCPYLQCDYCGTITKVFPCLKGLAELAVLLPKAEEFYSSGERREAMRIFTCALEILYKFSKPPCPDMIKVQQRLKTLFVHLGNKQCDYIEHL